MGTLLGFCLHPLTCSDKIPLVEYVLVQWQQTKISFHHVVFKWAFKVLFETKVTSQSLCVHESFSLCGPWTNWCVLYPSFCVNPFWQISQAYKYFPLCIFIMCNCKACVVLALCPHLHSVSPTLYSGTSVGSWNWLFILIFFTPGTSSFPLYWQVLCSCEATCCNWPFWLEPLNTKLIWSNCAAFFSTHHTPFCPPRSYNPP